MLIHTTLAKAIEDDRDRQRALARRHGVTAPLPRIRVGHRLELLGRRLQGAAAATPAC